MISIEFARLAVEGIRRTHMVVVESHPDGPASGQAQGDRSPLN